MVAKLPYVTAPGNIEKALRGIKSAATPEKVTQDFVKAILKIQDGPGSQMTAFLKKIGFANKDSTPSDIYKKFRNSGTTKSAAADALKLAYAPLYKRNEYMHELSDDVLKGLIIEETGIGDDSRVINFVLSAITSIKKFADFTDEVIDDDEKIEHPLQIPQSPPTSQQKEMNKMDMNLSYTINLNLPATSDISVFHAIFKSIKENLLSDKDE